MTIPSSAALKGKVPDFSGGREGRGDDETEYFADLWTVFPHRKRVCGTRPRIHFLSVQTIRGKAFDAAQGRSTIMETALPPPRQSVANPRFAPRSFIA